MITFVYALIMLVCLLLIVVVLVQNPKGGGLDSTFGASNQVLGVKKTGDFLEKSTWTLAVTLVLLSFFAGAIETPNTAVTKGPESVIQKQIDDEPFSGGGQQMPPVQEMSTED